MPFELEGGRGHALIEQRAGFSHVKLKKNIISTKNLLKLEVRQVYFSKGINDSYFYEK